jgi:hypothetical protein
MSVRSANADQRIFGMAPKPSVERMNKGGLLLQLAPSCATTGTPVEAVLLPFMDKGMNALVVEKRITMLKAALKHRKKAPFTPYKAEAWDRLLCQHNLHMKYPNLVISLQKGFDTGI